ncbi:hypothetical protein CC2G_002595 [Coprinopsis cinerea AmutBmut pab1-1]|nr:hypothetical protein CC2G_002595 [Coprinopsis cinerea AmutBmut pab1-1]
MSDKTILGRMEQAFHETIPLTIVFDWLQHWLYVAKHTRFIAPSTTCQVDIGRPRRLKSRAWCEKMHRVETECPHGTVEDSGKQNERAQ